MDQNQTPITDSTTATQPIPTEQPVVAQATATVTLPTEQPVVTVPESGKQVFNMDAAPTTETPAWLQEANKAVEEKKVEAVLPPENKIVDVALLANFRDVKPTETQLGVNPDSLIEVTPSLEVVEKINKDAAVKMTNAGYDPDTGRKLEKDIVNKSAEEVKAEEVLHPAETNKVVDASTLAAQAAAAPTPEAAKAAAIAEEVKPTIQEQAKAQESVAKKKSILDNLTSLFSGKTKAHDDAVAKIDLNSKDKISQEERKKYMEAEKIYQEGLSSIKDLIAPASMEILYDKIHMDGQFVQSFYVFAYPRYLEVNWLAPIINFDVTMDVSQFIYPISSGEIMKILRKKVAQMESSIRIDAEKGMVRDPAIETALEDAEQLRTEIQRGQEKFFQYAMYFTIYASSEKKLEKVTKQLESLLAGKLVMVKRAQIQAEHGFNSSIPICLDELYTIRNMNTGPLSTTFPFTSSDLTSDKGILYGINRHNDSLIIFDRFALENANSVVFAKSGAGKSYAVKLEILRMMMMGTDVIIIDPENEYQALANTVGGTYLKLSLNSDRRINPFDLPKPIAGEEVQPGDLLRSNVITLHGLLKLMLGDLNPAEESILDKALIDVYALKGITMDVVDPSAYQPPTMEDLYQILNSLEGAQGLVQRLSKFTTGSYSGIFNKPTNLDLTSGMMVFCIRDLEDALRPIAMYIILNYIWNRVRSEMKKRVLVIDEAWSMMQHEDSAKFLFGLVKRARKYYLGVTTITQDVEDFVKSDYGKSIITNSSMQLLLKQAPSAVDMLAKIFNLTEGEKYVLLNSGVGQGLFFAGMKHVAVQIIASYTEDKIVTTNPEELLKQREQA
ncbi:MAG: DUF87 domain-containing protein [Candidatus Peregrinibacteria bacterium]|nr:DUF87 domain-containing protein [Candidatus Peregrinibacteria bacterium]